MYQTTKAKGLHQIIKDNGNKDDLRRVHVKEILSLDDIQADKTAEELLGKKPKQGYLAISNALSMEIAIRSRNRGSR